MTNDTYHLVGSNGDIILFDDIQYVVLRDTLAGLSGIPVEYDVSYSPGLIGGDVHSASIIEREVSLHVAILGDSRNEIEQRRTRLITALNPANGESKFYWHREDGTIKYLRIRPASTFPSFEIGTNSTPKYWECSIELICYDPCWYSDTLITREFVRLAKGFKLPLQFPFTFGNRFPTNTITNNGSLPAPVEIILHGRITAPIVLTNVTSGKTLTIRRDIAEDEVLRINTAPDNTTVTVSNVGEPDGILRINSAPEHTTVSWSESGDVGTLNLTTTSQSSGVFTVDINTFVINTAPDYSSITAWETVSESNALYFCTIGSQFWQLSSGTNTISAQFTQVYNSAYGTISYRERYIGL